MELLLILGAIILVGIFIFKLFLKTVKRTFKIFFIFIILISIVLVWFNWDKIMVNAVGLL